MLSDMILQTILDFFVVLLHLNLCLHTQILETATYLQEVQSYSMRLSEQGIRKTPCQPAK